MFTLKNLEDVVDLRLSGMGECFDPFLNDWLAPCGRVVVVKFLRCGIINGGRVEWRRWWAL